MQLGLSPDHLSLAEMFSVHPIHVVSGVSRRCGQKYLGDSSPLFSFQCFPTPLSRYLWPERRYMPQRLNLAQGYKQKNLDSSQALIFSKCAFLTRVFQLLFILQVVAFPIMSKIFSCILQRVIWQRLSLSHLEAKSIHVVPYIFMLLA